MMNFGNGPPYNYYNLWFSIEGYSLGKHPVIYRLTFITFAWCRQSYATLKKSTLWIFLKVSLYYHLLVCTYLPFVIIMAFWNGTMNILSNAQPGCNLSETLWIFSILSSTYLLFFHPIIWLNIRRLVCSLTKWISANFQEKCSLLKSSLYEVTIKLLHLPKYFENVFTTRFISWKLLWLKWLYFGLCWYFYRHIFKVVWIRHLHFDISFGQLTRVSYSSRSYI